MESRKFGNTNRMVSWLGLGGGYLSAMSKEEGLRMVTLAFRSGINYFDIAPSYANGLNECIIREALGDNINKVFIATKVLARDYDNAKKEVEASLKRLGKVDLVQLHSVDTMDALDKVLSPKGALKAIEELKNQGVVKHIGITNHYDPKVLETSIERYKFDSVMMPLGVINAVAKNFEYLINKVKSTTAIVGILVFGDKKYKVSQSQALRYSLSLPATTILVGPRTTEELDRDITIADSFQPLNSKELTELKKFASNIVKTKTPWWLKGPIGVGGS